jgi:hypothetical protein
MSDTAGRPKHPPGKEIRDEKISYLERELLRSNRAVRNTRAKPFTIIWFARRKELLEAELYRRTRH